VVRESENVQMVYVAVNTVIVEVVTAIVLWIKDVNLNLDNVMEIIINQLQKEIMKEDVVKELDHVKKASVAVNMVTVEVVIAIVLWIKDVNLNMVPAIIMKLKNLLQETILHLIFGDVVKVLVLVNKVIVAVPTVYAVKVMTTAV